MKHFHGTSICAFPIMKLGDDGISKGSSINDLKGTVGDFSLPQSYKNVTSLLQK